MTPEEVINDTLKEWADEWIDKRKAGAEKAGLIGTGELVNSFQSALTLATPNQRAKAEFIFSTHGRYMDMKKLEFNRMPRVEALESYIRKKGVANFMEAHRKHRKYIPQDQDKLIKDIAFGMAIGIYRKNTLKRRRWYNKPAYQGIQILYRRLLDNLSIFTNEQIKAAMTNKNN
jgi:hypothetical protein